MFKRVLAAALVASLVVPLQARAEGLARPQIARADQQPHQEDKGLTTQQKAVIAAAIVAASVAAYLAMGRPCACPYSKMRDGKSDCGGRSAWSKAGGLKPLCYPTDITDVIFTNWVKDKKLPPLQ